MAAKKKTATKKAPVQKEKMVEVKETVKVEEKTANIVAEAKEAEAAKAVAETAPEVVTEEPAKAPAKKPAAKRTTKKAVKTTLYVQASGKEVSMDEAVARVKNAWVATGNKEADLKEISVYVKPEESSIYYVVNGDITGRVDF